MGPMVRDRAATDLLLELAQLAIARHSLPDVFGSFASGLVEGAAVDYASLLARDIETNTWRVVAIYPEVRARDVGGVPRVQEADIERLREQPAGLLYATEGDSPVLELFRSFGLRWAWSSLLMLESEVLGIFTWPVALPIPSPPRSRHSCGQPRASSPMPCAKR